MDKRYSGQTIVILALIFVIILLTFYTFSSKEDNYVSNANSDSASTTPLEDKVKKSEFENTALLDVYFSSWGENELDNSEIIFSYWINNYGDSESKNIEVKCHVYDPNGDIIHTYYDYAGNIASQSTSYKETVVDMYPGYRSTNYYSNSDETDTASCYINTCENCLILYKKIPELAESAD